MAARSWHWLRVRVFGLLQLPPAYRPDGVPTHTTRLGIVLFPPPEPKSGKAH